MTEQALLSCRGLSAGYRDRPVIHGCDLTLSTGTVTGMIGPNGAGKTTLLRALMGLCAVTSGTVLFSGEDIGAMPTAQRSLAGLGYVPQERKVFPGLSVADNLDIVARQAIHEPTERRERIDRCLEWFPRLKDRFGVVAGALSGGEQQMVAIAIALVRKPSLLLLDEPSLGLAPRLTEDMLATVAQICAEADMAAVIVEQNVRYLRLVTDRAFVVRLGAVSDPVDIGDGIDDLTSVF